MSKHYTHAMGPHKGLCLPRILCWPTQWSRAAVRHALGGPTRANGPNVTFMQWAHPKGVPPANSILCWPAREFRRAAHHIFNGPVRLNCPNVSCRHEPTRWSHAASPHILVGPMQANGPNVTLMQWACAKGAPPANCILCWPMREFRTVAHHVFDGPVRLNCPNVSCGHGPTRWSCAASPHILGGPMQANGPNVTLMQSAHTKGVHPANCILCCVMIDLKISFFLAPQEVPL